ncbi:hypothetical protein [Balneatrix alpica]|uniref:Uncharacterized protein n=1 Tax=Balneatrix alpica TaxID=75684 RepID=A0ABV5ZEI4_9GAMM|nr:hypothetical protein [Balneatrix alpica]
MDTAQLASLILTALALVLLIWISLKSRPGSPKEWLATLATWLLALVIGLVAYSALQLLLDSQGKSLPDLAIPVVIIAAARLSLRWAPLWVNKPKL